ncbi:MAG TPA: acyl-CoA dehydrogenase family protein, partial [Candidatus Binataceae bacterium]
LRQEMRAIGCRSPLDSFGIWMLGPALLKYGSEEQKREYLPKIARGEIRWCQGYSEPGAGSDLASLQTRAERQGDHFVVNGSKIWTSYADKADWIFCLVRTDSKAPKHEGISFLLFDMESPGVSTKPITLISGASPFCQTFFDNVLVPKANLVGELGHGWEIAKYLLTHEREMIGGMGMTGTRNRSLGEVAAEGVGIENGVLADPLLRAQIASFEIDSWAFSLTLERVGDMAKVGQAHPAISSMLKYYGCELNKRRLELMVAAAGSDALEWEGARSRGGYLARSWLRSKANSIEGGTSEVQLNIIAKRILGLPDA